MSKVKKKVKINQQAIADLLKVSRVTVTKALQGHADIALETRKKVQLLADELGYIPNGIGRSLVTRKTNTLGVILPKINHSFFSTITEQLYTTANELGYQIILMISFEDSEKEYEVVKTLLSMNVDGILIDTAATTKDNKSFELIRKHDTPLLFFDRKWVGDKHSGVFFQDYDLSFRLTTELINKGFTKLMYLTGSQEININRDRLEGFLGAMKSRNIVINQHWIHNTNLLETQGYEFFRDLIRKEKELPEAVLCVSDSVALGVYKACEEEGIKIPDELSVVGFGNTTLSSVVTPSLSTVDLEITDAAAKSVHNLVYLINNEGVSVNDEWYSGKVIFRNSIKPPR
jgi:LacI family transcriptional regulator